MAETNTNTAFDLGLFRRILSFTAPYRFWFGFVAVSAILLSGLSALRPYVAKLAIDDYILVQNSSGFLWIICLLAGVLLFEVLFQFLFVYYASWLGQHVILDIRKQLFKKMMGFKMAYFDKSAVGRLVTRAVSDIETIASIFSEGLFIIVSDLLKMLVILGFMFAGSWKLTLVVMTVLPFIIYATRLFQKAMKVTFEEVRTQISNLNAFVQERLTGMKIVQLFSREKIEHEKFRSINEKHRKAWIKTVWYNSIFFPVAELSASITVGLIVWYGGGQIVQGSGMSLGLIVAFIQWAQMLFRPLHQIADKFNTLQMGMVAGNRVFRILDTEASIEDKGTVEKKQVAGAISFKDVHFSYKPDEEVLKGISFEVKPGQKVALVGATGAGKSTVINLLSRFYEIDRGTISIDGIPIQEYRLDNLRNHVSVVLQDVFLFADTIYNNICLKNPSISREAVYEAAKSIGVHDFILSLPDAYDFDVKERGNMLSTGQRQLIAFLRACIAEPSILVLDEATSSIDTYSEILLQKATEKATENRTSIIIAHRLATIKNADLIVVLDQGKIVETGNHDSLLKVSGGFYRKLYEIQFSKEEVA